ncbi:globin-coupled sensor protein [Dongia rigui]|uniref:Globin-coupled sensor protein n=1 Tax=Dongia rigui TaxID=940149 RepID=A0ABU5DX04_9PROT|nr:globin-coupled sensor protein [Dongia rigui]MDY0871847.1 globin-coupled sensor protein [Dongia rigui]
MSERKPDLHIAERLAFSGIDANVLGVIGSFRGEIEAILPGAVAAFYDHLSHWPQLTGMFSSPARIEHAKAAQTTHWKRLFSGTLDEAYFESALKIGLIHAKIGLEPRWYIAAYHRTLSHLIRRAVIACYSRLHAHRATVELGDIVSAMTQLAMLDMDIAVSAYFEELQRQHGLDIERIGENFRGKVGSVIVALKKVSEHLQSGSTELTSSAHSAAADAEAVSQASLVTAQNVESVSAAAEELTAAINEIQRQTASASTIALQAVGEANSSNESVATLEQAAGHIGNVVRLIDDIAGHTNLLALNATIEAARAGDAGRGFQIVAAEVKGLSRQTAEATNQISSEIKAMQSATGTSAQAIHTIASTISRISDTTTAIAAAVEQQGAATTEIARSVETVSRSTTDVTNRMAAVASSIGVANRIADSVSHEITDLMAQTHALENEVEGFLNSLSQRA